MSVIHSIATEQRTSLDVRSVPQAETQEVVSAVTLCGRPPHRMHARNRLP